MSTIHKLNAERAQLRQQVRTHDRRMHMKNTELRRQLAGLFTVGAVIAVACVAKAVIG